MFSFFLIFLYILTTTVLSNKFKVSSVPAVKIWGVTSQPLYDQLDEDADWGSPLTETVAEPPGRAPPRSNVLRSLPQFSESTSWFLEHWNENLADHYLVWVFGLVYSKTFTIKSYKSVLNFLTKFSSYSLSTIQ